MQSSFSVVSPGRPVLVVWLFGAVRLKGPRIVGYYLAAAAFFAAAFFAAVLKRGAAPVLAKAA
jgi:hypothetical protein